MASASPTASRSRPRGSASRGSAPTRSIRKKPITRENVRDAIQATKLSTLQGEVSFDENGDIKQKVISVFQIKKDTAHPLNDTLYQYKYIGVAPAASS